MSIYINDQSGGGAAGGGDVSHKKSVATFADLPTSGNADGDLRVVRDEEKLYQWDADTSTWINVASGAVPGLHSSTHQPQASDELVGAFSETRSDIAITVDPVVGSDPPSTYRVTQQSEVPGTFETIQAAINVLPKRINHAVTVTIQPGNYKGIYLEGFQASSPNGSLIIQGVQELATLATGPNSGTATGSSATSLTLTGANWTPVDLEGRFVRIDSGAFAGTHRVIRSNTADTLTVFSFGGDPGLAAFSIVEPATILDTGITEGPWSSFQARVGIRNVFSGSPAAGGEITLQDLRLEALDGWDCYDANDCTVPPILRRCQLVGGNGYYAQDCLMVRSWEDNAFLNNSYYGIWVQRCQAFAFNFRSVVRNAGLQGVITRAGRFWVSNLDIGGSASHGLRMLEGGLGREENGTLTGSGNAGYGIALEDGAHYRTSPTTDITGTSGDLSVGDTTSSYADFRDPSVYNKNIVDLGQLCRLYEV